MITAAAIKAAPAFAEPTASPDVSVSIIQTADLDLSTSAGRHSLDRRLVRAASEVCGTASEVDLVGKNKVAACRHSVLAEARAKGEQLARQGNPIAVASR
jgi:UrcA family protein